MASAAEIWHEKLLKKICGKCGVVRYTMDQNLSPMATEQVSRTSIFKRRSKSKEPKRKASPKDNKGKDCKVIDCMAKDFNEKDGKPKESKGKTNKGKDSKAKDRKAKDAKGKKSKEKEAKGKEVLTIVCKDCKVKDVNKDTKENDCNAKNCPKYTKVCSIDTKGNDFIQDSKGKDLTKDSKRKDSAQDAKGKDLTDTKGNCKGKDCIVDNKGIDFKVKDAKDSKAKDVKKKESRARISSSRESKSKNRGVPANASVKTITGNIGTGCRDCCSLFIEYFYEILKACGCIFCKQVPKTLFSEILNDIMNVSSELCENCLALLNKIVCCYFKSYDYDIKKK